MVSALTAPIYQDVRYYYGDLGTPRDVYNLRRSTQEAMRRLGTPVILKRVYTIRDVEATPPRAQKSPAWSNTYQGVRQNDPLTNGVGLCSLDTQPGEWYDTNTYEVIATDPDANNPDFDTVDTYAPAPRYRGYGPGFLTYCILPDAAEDVFKVDPRGTLTRMQNATVQLPWWPIVGDNDLLVSVSLDDAGWIQETYERYQLKMVTPTTMRGTDYGGRRTDQGAVASGNRYWVGQSCMATIVPMGSPEWNPIYNVETDR